MSETIQASRLFDSTILVVDDVEMNRRMLSHSLNAHGYNKVLTAADGAEALQITRDKNPDLVILDLMMPGMDGFSYCKFVRQEPQFHNMPIIVQTALNDMEQKLKAFQYGANDYICKPVDPGELSARTQVHLSNKLLMEDLHGYRQRMTDELDSARQMQDRLMPTDNQVKMCGRVFDMKIAHHFETSSALGGDCWGMRPISDHRLGVYIFDFSGRGMTSAMNVFRMHTIISDLMTTGGEPGHFLSALNQQLYPLLGRNELATMFYGLIDTDANCLVYASAAAPAGLLFPRGEEAPIQLGSSGFPLGAISNAIYDTKYAPYSSGDLLVLHSDCISETQNARGEFLTEKAINDSILDVLKIHPIDPARSAVDALLGCLNAHNPAPIFDDNTITAYWRSFKE